MKLNIVVSNYLDCSDVMHTVIEQDPLIDLLGHFKKEGWRLDDRQFYYNANVYKHLNRLVINNTYFTTYIDKTGVDHDEL